MHTPDFRREAEISSDINNGTVGTIGRCPFVGKRVTIVGGNWKGKMGFIMDWRNTTPTIRIELGPVVNINERYVLIM
jgi:transcription elongation factor